MTINKKVLALKYRPQVFKDLVGQEIIVETIERSILVNNIPNAFLFTGIRGVGKTTIARILAKSLNCSDKKKNNCLNNCDNCKEISESRHIDVLEMDAASKTGVDDVRDLIDFSRYGPTKSKYKIFIIDEVHMLSKQAFNALLKTLEEPPNYLKFIFATTEVNKIPVTVLSRCQRFDLARVQSENLLKYLKSVLSTEKKDVDKEVLKLIVKMSEGSVRDSLSLLDRILLTQYGDNKKLGIDTAQKIFGYFDKSYLIELLEKLLKGEESLVIELYRKIYNQGVEPKIFLNNFLEIIYYLKNIDNLSTINSSINLNDTEIKKLEELSQKIDNQTLLLFWQFSIETINEINLVTDQNLSIEMFLIRLLYLKDDFTDSKDSLANLKKKQNNELLFENKNINKESHTSTNKTINQIKISSQELQKQSVEDDIIEDKLEINSFENLISACLKKKEIKLKYELENNVNLVSFKKNNIQISFNENLDKNFIKNLSSKLMHWTGERWIILLSKKNGSETAKQKNINFVNKEIEILKKSQTFREALNIFPDLEITKVDKLIKREPEENE